MRVYNSTELLETLRNDVEQLLSRVEDIKKMSDTSLNEQPSPGKWSIAQVLEHLNSYNRYYLPEIKQSLSKKTNFKPVFKPGLFGNYFTNMMAPKDRKVTNKMKAPKDHTPAEKLDAQKVIAAFIDGQQRLLQLLKMAEKADIGKLKVPISISRFIKLKLGDTFRFLIAHQQRHFLQIENILVHSAQNQPRIVPAVAM